MNKFKSFAVIVAIALLSGCAHKIQLNPNTAAFVESEKRIDTVVGYYLSEEDRKKSVTTPGGGGDKITYSPYKDTESILFTVLSNKFKDVYLVKSLEDSSFIKDNEIKLIFIPKIITQSSSSSAFTWPPTKFVIDLTIKALNSSGDTVWQKNIKETGEAEFDEFKADFSLSARRAAEQAFLQLAKDIEQDVFLLN